MALTRRLLKGMGITEEQQDTIIEAHTDTVNALKRERDQYKEAAEKLPSVQQELDALKEKGDDDGYKAKYEAEKEAHDKLKKDIAEKETSAKKKTAVRELLRESGIAEKRLDAVLRLYDLDKVELGEDGSVKNKEKHMSYIKEDFDDYIETQQGSGNPTPNPQTRSDGKMTKEEIFAIKDRAARREAIAQNMDLFN